MSAAGRGGGAFLGAQVSETPGSTQAASTPPRVWRGIFYFFLGGWDLNQRPNLRFLGIEWATELRDLPAWALRNLTRPCYWHFGNDAHRDLSSWLDRWKRASESKTEPQPAWISLPVKAVLDFSGVPWFPGRPSGGSWLAWDPVLPMPVEPRQSTGLRCQPLDWRCWDPSWQVQQPLLKLPELRSWHLLMGWHYKELGSILNSAYDFWYMRVVVQSLNLTSVTIP